ncbi:hypothetical protein [Corallococcus carmarthensis]|uniref:hypothetical protein n=1 Tax=Corallococcus carmarthensis TaxID=2316728 RepID=UPI0011C37F89|nr:hypothetical protein [Corallococcus carmarthensis]
MTTGRHRPSRYLIAAAGVSALAGGFTLGACSSWERTSGPSPTQAVAAADGYLSPPFPVFPHGNTLTQSLADNHPSVQQFLTYYGQRTGVTLPNPARASLFALPKRSLDIAHNGLDLASGNFNSSLVCQSCHDSDWKASGTNLPQMSFWAQPGVAQVDPSGKMDLASNWSLFGDWSGSIKALAARDPVFLAQVENTRGLSPNQPEQVDNLCLRCHSPLGQRQANQQGKLFSHFMLYSTPEGSGYKSPVNDPNASPANATLGALGRDGVSCAACHDVAPAQGQPWNGTDFTVFYGSEANSVFGANLSNRLKDTGDSSQPPAFPFTSHMNTRPGSVVGPDTGLNIAPMAAAGLGLETATNAAGGQPYLRDATVCGSCHVVVLPKVPDKYSKTLTVQEAQARGGYVKPASCPPGQKNFTGDFLTDPCVGLAYEQTTYFEWLNSGYATQTASCLTCHMQLASASTNDGFEPVAQVNADLAKFYQGNTATTPRQYNRHSLLGVNLFVHEMFQQFPDVLGIEYYPSENSVVPPFLQSPPIRTRTGNLIQNPGAENGDTKGWMVAAGTQMKAVTSDGNIKPQHGQYFFSLRSDAVVGTGATMTFDVSQYAPYIDRNGGEVKVNWGASLVYKNAFERNGKIQLTFGGSNRIPDEPEFRNPQYGTWLNFNRTVQLSPGTRSLTVVLPPSIAVDDLFLSLTLPEAAAPLLQDASRSYAVAKNLLNAEQSILDLAVNTSQGVYNPLKPAVQVSVAPPTNGGATQDFAVTVTNNVGHKFPSGAGFRRAFVQFELLGDGGRVLWASGQPNAWGAICQGACNAAGSNTLPAEFATDPRQLQPHRQVITDESQAQIYELRVVDDYNHLTSTELQQFQAVKDNRLLPLGWVPSAERKPSDALLGLKLQELATLTEPTSSVLGAGDTSVSSDPDYNAKSAPGLDRITYRVPTNRTAGWKSARVRVNYQTIPPGYLAARFKEGLTNDLGQPKTPGPAMSRLIYMTSRLNNQSGLSYAPDPNQPSQKVDFMSNWTMVLGEWTQVATP